MTAPEEKPVPTMGSDLPTAERGGEKCSACKGDPWIISEMGPVVACMTCGGTGTKPSPPLKARIEKE